MNLDALIAMMRDQGVTRLYFKPLAANDNAKNQFYLGPNLDALNVLPTGPAAAEIGSHGKAILKASVNLSWLTDAGTACRAPKAQVIYYPQYPEVRLGSLSISCEAAPKAMLGSRDPGRVLLLGITADRRVLARLISPDDPAAHEVLVRSAVSSSGVFTEIGLGGSPRAELIGALKRVADRGWLPASRLDSDGRLLPCVGRNCGGLTLEAALGVRPNSVAGPDFAGWEIKQHGVKDLERPRTGTLTLMTPEPDGGWYKERGVESFIRTFGYPDTLGRPDRLNFGGRHSVGSTNNRTGLGLTLFGFDSSQCRVSDASGSLALTGTDGTVAASWSFAKLLNHWKKKHARAAYVPSLLQTGHAPAYRYGYNVCLGVGTSLELLLGALDRGSVFYDPGLKLEEATSARPKTKRRSQIRVGFVDLSDLYDTFEYVDMRRV